MKTMCRNLILITILSIFFFSCNSDTNGDSTPPGSVSVVKVTPTSGGGIIEYQLPEDNDLLFVQADYTDAQGNSVFRTSSYHNNSIEITGFVTTDEVEIELTAVDENQNFSKPVKVNFNPLQSFIYTVQQSLTLTEDLGGVRVNWTNPNEKTVYVFLDIDDGSGNIETRILSSSNKNANTFVRGLKSVETDFFARVEDLSGNTTQSTSLGKYTPLFEEKIDKSTWTLVSNLSVDGNAWEGKTENFWDDVIDTAASGVDDSYFIIWRNQNGGVLNWPLDIVIDLNKEVKLSRFTVWQRAFWYGGPEGEPYYYQEENLKSFELFVSNDKTTWESLGTFDIGDPRDVSGNIPSEALEQAANGHGFEFEFITQSFRYLKFSITSNYGSDTYVHGSEISLFGIDNL